MPSIPIQLLTLSDSEDELTDSPNKNSITVLHKDLAHIQFSSTLQFYLNGKLQTVKNPNPESRLIDYIRDYANLKGTKEACSESGCNACSVTIASLVPSFADSSRQEIKYTAVNSCVTPLILVEGKHVITVEGVGSAEDPHPVQERIAKFHGSQCGFCTPGFVMALYSLLRQKEGVVSVEEIDEALESNLCRCTGYMPIADAAYSFAHDSDNYNKEKIRPFLKKQIEQKQRDDCGSGNGSTCAMGDKCCKNKKNNGKSTTEVSTEFPDSEIDMNKLFTPNGLPLKPYNPGNDIQFPLKLARYSKKPIFYGNDRKVWFRPTTKRELLEIYNSYPDAKLVAGASEVLIEVKFKHSNYPVNIYVNDVEELKTWEYIDGKGLLIGGNLPLIELEHICENLSEKLGKTSRGQVFYHICQQLKLFASKAVRNVATAAGNIVTASPIADLNPILVACGAIITAEKINENGEFESIGLSMRDDYFTGYRRTKLPPNSIVSSIFIPETQQHEFLHAYKQSKRKDDDISIVTACLQAQLDTDGKIVNSTLVYGGMAPMTVQSKKTQEFIKGKSIINEKFVEEAIDILANQDFNLSFSVPGGMATYRRSLTLSFFYKFWQYMISNFSLFSTRTKNSLVDIDSLSQVTRNQKHGFRDINQFEPYIKEGEIVGKSIVHLNAFKQAAGEAEYTDDLPPQYNELFAAQVLSSKAHARILSIDYTEALKVESVVGYVDINDLHDRKANLWGALPFGKEPFFADGEVFFVGQTISLIVANDKERAYEASRLVKIEYEDLPAIISVEDGLAAKSFFPDPEHPDKRETKLGDWEKAFKESEYYLENTCRLSAQEHFYFEPQNCLIIPEEQGELKVYSSTQNPNECQEYCAQITGVDSNRVVVRVKRLGGGFGGKETRSVQLAGVASAAAKKFHRPVRMQLNRSEDMLITGQRHPFLCKYRVSMNKDLKFTGIDIELYANAGWSMDLTRGVIDRSVFHATNSYYFPNARVCGIPVKTNVASNTAYRSFGSQAGMYAAEAIVTEFAEKLGIDPEIIRQKNYFIPDIGQTTTYRQKITKDISIRELVRQNLEDSKYDELKKQVDEFNSKSKWIKRGLAHVPCCFGVSFGVLFLNQAGALINIYMDGSVLIGIAGVEIGQGISTIMRMIVAQGLKVPIEKVFLSETSTQTVPNGSATAASTGSDLNGKALQNACDKINARLIPIREMLTESNQNYTWDELITKAYLERVSLSATGFYKTPDIGFDFNDPSPTPRPQFFYHTQGSAVALVELDTLTGDWVCLESHIKMDVGKPLNEAIIYGQIEGAFIQGMGYFTIEQSLWFRHNGALFTRGPGAYKIPGFRDIPQVFNVSMLKGDFKHLRTVHSSKGVGEPPFFLGSVVQFALRDAISFARKEHGIEGGSLGLEFSTPLTTERIRNACGDFIVNKGVVEPKDENEKDFFIEA